MYQGNSRSSRFLVAGLYAAALSIVAGCGSAHHSVDFAPVFNTVVGPGGGATTINGISNTNNIAGFTTNNGTNTNFIEPTGGPATVVNVGDPAAGMITAANSSGELVGVANGYAFSIVNGVQKTISVPGSTASIALGVNDAGIIVGQDTVGANTPGFVDNNGAFTTIQPTPTATVVNVQGINNLGQAIGFYSADGVHQHGFLYNIASKAVVLLPDPQTPRTSSQGLVLTQFLGLNDNGEAVGYYQTTTGSQYGFLFNLVTKQYTFLDEVNAAPVAGVQITQITGVSNSGEICGFYIDATGTQFGFTATGTTLAN